MQVLLIHMSHPSFNVWERRNIRHTLLALSSDGTSCINDAVTRLPMAFILAVFRWVAVDPDNVLLQRVEVVQFCFATFPLALVDRILGLLGFARLLRLLEVTGSFRRTGVGGRVGGRETMCFTAVYGFAPAEGPTFLLVAVFVDLIEGTVANRRSTSWST